MNLPLPYCALECVPEAIIVLAPYSNQFVYANENAANLLKEDTAALYEQPVSNYFAPSLPELIVFTERVFYNQHGSSENLAIKNSSHEQIDLEVNAAIDHRQPQHMILSLRNKKHLQQWRMLTASDTAHHKDLLHWRRIQSIFDDIEKKNALILGAAGEGIYGIDCEGKATFVNPAAERMLGWKSDELIGVNIHSVIHHSHADGSDFCVVDCPIYSAFREGEVRKVEDDIFWKKDGHKIPVEYTSTPIIENNQLAGAVVIFRDISERKEAEIKLRSALAEVKQLKHRLELENAYLQEEINENYNSHQIIGKSLVVQQIIEQIQLVAPTDATVLISGESGTGKELIARAIHKASSRKDRPLIRVNCAAIPRDLFESEFFGHARGAFSGAHKERQGRFEVADGGTLFLDEVGELPLELQGKLLRALQDGEFERVGESITRNVNVRVIAATNRKLIEQVRDGHFREDFYFRLNVFPIRSAPLRERREDIPLLVSCFLKKACHRFNKSALSISVGHMQQLQQYSWPGNIRELENFIERQVILSRGDKLQVDSLVTPSDKSNESNEEEKLLAITESECINFQKRATLQALRQTKGKIYGENGAARILGVKPTTLASRIKKWGL